MHTVLSPCGDLEMSPVNIIREAKAKGLDIVGITDHNSTRQAPIVRNYGRKEGIYVLTGVEINTREEIHCLAFFENDLLLAEFQAYLDAHLPDIANNPDRFGYQVVVDTDDNILYEEPKLLISGINQAIHEVEQTVHRLNGIFIPAHIDKPVFSIVSQLYFMPDNLQVDALELSSHTDKESFTKKRADLKNYCYIRSSDAHYVEDIGKVCTILDINNLTFSEIKRILTSKSSAIVTP